MVPRRTGLSKKRMEFIVTTLLLSILAGLLVALLWHVLVTKPDAERTAQVGVLRGQWILSFLKPVKPKIAFGGAILQLEGAAVEDGAFNVFGDRIRIWIRWGRLRVSARVRTSTGSQILEIENSEWKVNPNNIFDRNFTKRGLEVRDNNGQVAFHVLICGDTAVLEGRFFDGAGSAAAIAAARPPFPAGGIIEIRHQGQPLQTQIDQWFRYPSALHLGEMEVSETELCRRYTRAGA